VTTAGGPPPGEAAGGPIRDGSTAAGSIRATSIWDRLIESGWLLALAAIPVFFNAYSLRAFEPDKAAVLRTLAILMAAMWVGKGLTAALAARRNEPGVAMTRPGLALSGADGRTLLLALSLFAWLAVTSIFSILPLQSLTGSYHRDQGLDTAAALLVILLSMVVLMRSRTQVERAITAVLIASCPIAVYALVQNIGLDPVLWARPAARPVVSTMGNALFLAGFLILLVPLTAYRLVLAAGEFSRGGAGRTGTLITIGVLACIVATMASWARSPDTGSIISMCLLLAWLAAAGLTGRRLTGATAIAAYTTLLSLQIAAVILSASRGPFLGLLCSGFFFALLVAARLRSRPLLAGLAAISLALLATLALIRLPDTPLSQIQDSPVAGRLSSVLDTGGSARVRLLLWQQALDTTRADPLRAMIGHGPETGRLAMSPHYPAALGQVEDRAAEPDRAHNELMDRLVTTGVVGASLYYAFLFALLATGLRSIGVLHPERGVRRLLVNVGISVVLLTGLVRWFDESWRLIGLSLPLGLLVGTALSVGLSMLRGPPQDHRTRLSRRALLGIALVAATLGHIVEIHFGIPTISSSLVFWAIAALLVINARDDADAADTSLVHVRGETAMGSADADASRLAAGLAVFGVVIVTLGFGFHSAGASVGEDPPYAWLLRVCFVLCGSILLVTTWRPEPAATARLRMIEFAAYYLSVTIAGLLLSAWLARQPGQDFLGMRPAITGYFIVLTVVWLLLAGSLRRGENTATGTLPTGSAVKLAALLLAAMPAIWFASFRPLMADVATKQGSYALAASGRENDAVAAFERAYRLGRGRVDFVYFLTGALAAQAVAEDDSARRDELFGEAERLLTDARDRHPVDVQPVLNLGRLQARWAALTEDAQARQQRIGRALGNLEAASALTPARPIVWNAYGTAWAIAGRPDEARRRFEHSLSLDPKYADTYLLLARSHIELEDRKGALAVLERGSNEADTSAMLQRSLASAYRALGQEEDAAAAYQRALELAPNERASRVARLGRALDAGDCDQAVATLQAFDERYPGDPELPRLRGLVIKSCAGRTVTSPGTAP
jgi:tetratricopeptide (TPR) repeat protein